MKLLIANVYPLLVIAFLISSCSSVSEHVYTKSLLSTSTAGSNVWTEKVAGETTPLPKPYTGHPPLIPHSTLDVTIDDCIMCHGSGYKASKDHIATKIPASHFLNAFTGEKTSETPIGIRHNCLQCHVPQAAEQPPYEEDLK